MRKTIVAPEEPTGNETPQAFIDKLKAENPGHKLFKVEVGARTFIMKDMLHYDYTQNMSGLLRTAVPEEDQDTYLVLKYLLDPMISPIEIGSLPAGTMPTLKNVLFQKSGFSALPVTTAVGDDPEQPFPTDEQAQIVRAKQPGDLMLSRLTVMGYTFIVRGVRRVEFKKAKAAADAAGGDQDVFSELIVRAGLCWPEVDVDTIPAGLIEVVSTEIARLSGFQEPSTVVDL